MSTGTQLSNQADGSRRRASSLQTGMSSLTVAVMQAADQLSCAVLVRPWVGLPATPAWTYLGRLGGAGILLEISPACISRQLHGRSLESPGFQEEAEMVAAVPEDGHPSKIHSWQAHEAPQSVSAAPPCLFRGRSSCTVKQMRGMALEHLRRCLHFAVLLQQTAPALRPCVAAPGAVVLFPCGCAPQPFLMTRGSREQS